LAGFFIKPLTFCPVLSVFINFSKNKTHAMKTMKNMPTCLIILMLMLGQAATAQQPPVADTATKKYGSHPYGKRGERSKKMAEANREMMKQLNLSEDQQRQLRDLRQGEMATMQKLRNDTTLTPQARKDRMKSIRDEHLEKMKQLLTPEQFNKMQEFRKQQKAEFSEKGKKRAEAMRAKMKELNLSEVQRTQLREIRKGAMTSLRKLRSDTGLTPEARMDGMRKIRMEQTEKLKQVLTPEQFTRLQEFRKQQMGSGKTG
jgi:Spy/CpxP family protein refolding chaperone